MSKAIKLILSASMMGALLLPSIANAKLSLSNPGANWVDSAMAPIAGDVYITPTYWATCWKNVTGTEFIGSALKDMISIRITHNMQYHVPIMEQDLSNTNDQIVSASSNTQLLVQALGTAYQSLAEGKASSQKALLTKKLAYVKHLSEAGFNDKNYGMFADKNGYDGVINKDTQSYSYYKNLCNRNKMYSAITSPDRKNLSNLTVNNTNNDKLRKVQESSGAALSQNVIDKHYGSWCSSTEQQNGICETTPTDDNLQNADFSAVNFLNPIGDETTNSVGIGGSSILVQGSSLSSADQIANSTANDATLAGLNNSNTAASCKANAECAKLAEAIYYEARGESTAGQIAVAQVIVNRSKSGKYPNSITGVVNQKSQFSYINDKNVKVGTYSDSAAYNKALAVASGSLNGSYADQVGGATNYLNPVAATDHSWEGNLGENAVKIGNHVFGIAGSGQTVVNGEPTQYEYKNTVASEMFYTNSTYKPEEENAAFDYINNVVYAAGANPPTLAERKDPRKAEFVKSYDSSAASLNLAYYSLLNSVNKRRPITEASSQIQMSEIDVERYIIANFKNPDNMTSILAGKEKSIDIALFSVMALRNKLELDKYMQNERIIGLLSAIVSRNANSAEEVQYARSLNQQ
jgi:hypothetical protein